MIKKMFIKGKTLSIKYNLITDAKPKFKDFANIANAELFPIQFEILYNRKINRRTSSFFEFQKLLNDNSIKFEDHYIDIIRYNELIEDGEGSIKWNFSDLVFYEKMHIYFLLKSIGKIDSESFTLSRFSEAYQKSLIFPKIQFNIKFKERVFPDIAFLLFKESLDILNSRLYSSYDANLPFPDIIKVWKNFFQLLNNSRIQEFDEITKPYIDAYHLIDNCLTPNIKEVSNFYNDGQVESIRIPENFVTTATWKQFDWKNKLINLANETKIQSKLKDMLEDLDKNINEIHEEITQLLTEK